MFHYDFKPRGVCSRAIHIDLDDGTMTIEAERHSEHEEKDKAGNYLRCERSYGSYRRSFDINAQDPSALAVMS
jgi:HSP20 family protein